MVKRRTRSGVVWRQGQETPRMQDVLPDGGVIRNLWIGEADKYRDHLLRLDPATGAPVRRRGVGRLRQQLRRSVDFARSRGPWLFRRRRVRGGAELRQLGVRFPRQAEAAYQRREALAVSWRRLGAAAPNAARRAQPRLSAVAHGVPRRQPAHAAARPQVRRGAVVRFRQRGRRVGSSRANPLSVMQEFMADSHGFATAMLDLQSRLLRA